MRAGGLLSVRVFADTVSQCPEVTAHPYRRGYVVGNDGLCMVTNNAGLNWGQISVESVQENVSTQITLFGVHMQRFPGPGCVSPSSPDSAPTDGQKAQQPCYTSYLIFTCSAFLVQ